MISRRWLFALHGALARVLGALLVVTLATGTLATIAVDLERAMEPQGAAALGPGALDVLERWALHESRSIRLVTLGGDEGAWAYTIDVHGRWQRSPLDPEGHPIATLPLRGAHAVLRDVHRELFLGHAALYVITPLSLVLLALTLSGATSQTRLALRIRGRSVHGRAAGLHRVLGTLALAPALLFSLTGLVYLAETIVEDLGQSLEITPPREAPPREAPPREAPAARSLEALLETARDEAPWLTPRRLVVGRSPGVLLVSGPGRSALVRETASFVALDVNDGAVLASHEASASHPLDLAADLADPLHFGSFGGRATRLVWLVLGLALTALALTGLRTGRSRHHAAEAQRLERRASVVVSLVWLASLFGGLVLHAGELAPSGQLALALSLASAIGALALTLRQELAAPEERARGKHRSRG